MAFWYDYIPHVGQDNDLEDKVVCVIKRRRCFTHEVYQGRRLLVDIIHDCYSTEVNMLCSIHAYGVTDKCMFQYLHKYNNLTSYLNYI